MVEEKGELNRLGGVEAYDTIHQLENSNLLLMADYLERRHEMSTVFHRPGEKIPELFTTDEHNIETDWEYYTTLLASQRHIETTGAHIAAHLQSPSRNFPTCGSSPSRTLRMVVLVLVLRRATRRP